MTRQDGPDAEFESVEALKRGPISVTLTLAAAGDYAALDVMSESATNNAGAAKAVPLGRGKANDLVDVVEVQAFCSTDAVRNRLRLHFFRANPATTDVEMDDNSVFTITTFTNYEGYIDLPAFADFGGAAYAQATDFVKRLLTAVDSNNVYMCVQTLDAEANEGAGMTLRLDFYLE